MATKVNRKDVSAVIKDNTIGEATLHAYTDGELDHNAILEVEDWLKNNSDDATEIQHWKKQKERLKTALDPVLEEEIPQRFMDSLKQSETINKSNITFFRRNHILQIAASILFMFIGGNIGWYAAQPNKPKWPALAVQAVGSHIVYTSDTKNLVEFPATDITSLRTWISNQVGPDITIPDFSSQGFELVGGRVVPLNNKAAAVFLYRNKKQQIISLLVAHDKSALNIIEKLWTRGNVNCFFWFQKPLGFALTGELDQDTLQSLTKKTQQHFSEI